MRKSKMLVWGIAGLFALAIAVRIAARIFDTSSGSSGPNSPKPQGPVTVQTTAVEYRHMTDKAEFTGTVKPSYEYVISAKIPGRLISLNKRIGDAVRSNETVGRIDDTEYRQALDEALAQVRVSQASLTEARAHQGLTARELARVTELVGKGISSQSELDGLQTQAATYDSRVELAQAQLAQRQAVLSQVQTRLNYTSLRAAHGGLVATRHTDGGALLSTGSPVLTVVGIDTVYITLSLTEQEYARVSTNMPARVTLDALTGRAFEGVIRNTAPFFDQTSRTASAEVALRNDSLLLKPGMFARISITFSQKDSALAVPSSAIVRTASELVVFTVDSATARSVTIQRGLLEGDWVEILSPVISGPVVTTGNHLLRDGMKVRLSDEGSAANTGKGR